MAAVLNRTTKQYLRSANTPDYPAADWIINPDISAVNGWPTKYWIITGDVITLMDQAARDAVDAAEAAAALADAKTEADAAPDSKEALGVEFRALIAILNQRDNYLVNRISELQAALDTVRDTAGNAAARLDTLPASWLATNTRDRPDAVQAYRDEISSGGADS